MNKKGFTLVEVLAVIILLGLIAAILIPNYNKTIEKSKKNSFKESLNGLVRTIENYVANNPNEIVQYKQEYTNIFSIELDADNINQLESGYFIIDDNNQVELLNVYNGRYCGSGKKNEFTIIKGECPQ